MAYMSSGVMPSINLPRTKRPFKVQVSTTMEHGRLIPIYCERVIPGNEYNWDLSSLIRMSTPILPIMSDISMRIDCFFVPLRQVWCNAEHFFGAKTSQVNKNGIIPNVDSSTFLVPYRSLYSDHVDADSLSHYLGKPIVGYSGTKLGYGYASPLKERGYYHIWNTFYRAKKIQDPVLIAFDGNGYNGGNAKSTHHIGTYKGADLEWSSKCLKVNKVFDYFTTALLSPEALQVSIPLGDFAPVVLYKSSSGTLAADSTLKTASSITSIGQSAVYAGTSTAGVDLRADLKNAVGTYVEDLRTALAIEHYEQRMEYAGDDFQSILLAQFGTTNGNRSLQLPEHLGSVKFKINISQVTAMADTTQTIGGVSATKPAGSSAAVSITGNKAHLCAKSFGEPGFIYVLAFARQDNQLYSQGLLREDFEFDIHSWFNPAFAFIHDMKIYNKEIYLQGTNADDQVFGYGPAWENERRQINRVSGYLDPAVTNSIAPWTLANKFDALPNLSSSFIEEDRSMLTRALTTGNAGPDYICDFYITGTKTSLVPSESVPNVNGNMKV